MEPAAEVPRLATNCIEKTGVRSLLLALTFRQALHLLLVDLDLPGFFHLLAKICQEPTDQDFSAKKDQIRDSLIRSKQQDLFGLFLTNLRQQMEKSGKIKINEQEVKSLTKGQGGEEGF